MKKSNQHGFTGPEVVIIVLAVIAIGLAGYLAYQGRQARIGLTPSVQPKTTKSPSMPIEMYISAPQLGVSFKITEGLKGHGIKILPATREANGALQAEITSTTLEPMSNYGTPGLVGYLIRYEGSAAGKESVHNHGEFVKQFSRFHIVLYQGHMDDTYLEQLSYGAPGKPQGDRFKTFVNVATLLKESVSTSLVEIVPKE